MPRKCRDDSWNDFRDDSCDDGPRGDAGARRIGRIAGGGLHPSSALCAAHVERSGLCHRWFKLDAKRGEFSYPARFDALCDLFYRDCHRLGVTRLTEGANVPWVEAQ